jgi:hypothetical protein
MMVVTAVAAAVVVVVVTWRQGLRGHTAQVSLKHGAHTSLQSQINIILNLMGTLKPDLITQYLYWHLLNMSGTKPLQPSCSLRSLIIID